MVQTRDDFYTVLSAAIDDIIEHGFDDLSRIEKWTREIRIAAERSMIRPEVLDQTLREHLAKIYSKLVERGGIARYQKGIDRFTLEQIKPALRGELDRRIMASASLIKLNRAEAIEKTLRRFEGWSTSIPKGGVSTETKAEVRANVRKSLAQLPFEERRVLIDQGHKLISSINEVVALQGGAIAGQWVSHFLQPNYAFRPAHKERDYRQNNDEPFLIRDSWAHAAGLVKKGKLGFVDEVSAPAQEPFCRCYYRFVYSLSALPENMLTAKGKKALAESREKAAAFTKSRSDDAGPPPVPKVSYAAHAMRLERLKQAL